MQQLSEEVQLVPWLVYTIMALLASITVCFGLWCDRTCRLARIEADMAAERTVWVTVRAGGGQ